MKHMEKQLRNLDLSKIHFHSYGIVAMDNVDNEKEIKVFPVEKLYLENGETIVKNGSITQDEDYKPTTYTVKEKILTTIPEDIEPRHIIKEEALSLVKTKYLYSTWLNINNPNRYTPPNVCLGEKVIIYKYGNSDRYFWDTLGFELNLRKEDHVVDVYSDKPEINEDDVANNVEEDLEDTYYIMKSPKNKIVKLHTTDKYGELTTYDITLNTKDGTLEVLDGKGNYILLDSDKDTYTTNINKDLIDTVGNDRISDIKNDENITIGNERKTDIAKNDTETIGDTKTISLKKIAIKNDTTELISLLSEYIATHITEQHIGNLGIPTVLTGDFISKYQDIKSRLDTLKV